MEHCTIYSENVDYSIVRDIKRIFPQAVIIVDGDETHWASISVQEGTQSLVINSKVRKQPGDEFSKIVMGSYTHFKKLPVRMAPFPKDEFLKGLSRSEWLLGVVSEPGFEVASHERAILEITAKLKGFIFDGSAVLAANGEVLLGS